jgi:hypothetical protein
VQERLRLEEQRLMRGGEDGALDLDQDDRHRSGEDEDEDGDADEDARFPGAGRGVAPRRAGRDDPDLSEDSDADLTQDPARYPRRDGREAAAFGNMGADVGGEASDLSASSLTDDAEDELLGGEAGEDDLLDGTDEDDF